MAPDPWIVVTVAVFSGFAGLIVLEAATDGAPSANGSKTPPTDPAGLPASEPLSGPGPIEGGPVPINFIDHGDQLRFVTEGYREFRLIANQSFYIDEWVPESSDASRPQLFVLLRDEPVVEAEGPTCGALDPGVQFWMNSDPAASGLRVDSGIPAGTYRVIYAAAGPSTLWMNFGPNPNGDAYSPRDAVGHRGLGATTRLGPTSWDGAGPGVQDLSFEIEFGADAPALVFASYRIEDEGSVGVQERAVELRSVDGPSCVLERTGGSGLAVTPALSFEGHLAGRVSETGNYRLEGAYRSSFGLGARAEAAVWVVELGATAA